MKQRLRSIARNGGLIGALLLSALSCADHDVKIVSLDDSETAPSSTAPTDSNVKTSSDSEISTDTDTTDSESDSWVSIPSGEFLMGCVPQDATCAADESPRHRVHIDAFEMTRTEITQGQYREVTGSNPSNNALCGDSCPVENVDWNSAVAFCEAVGGRLPAEAEWEYAARAGSTTIFTSGDSVAGMDQWAWYYANSSGITKPTGQKAMNDFGLYDMFGNVWEWTADCYVDSYIGAPVDGRARNEDDCSFRVLRGGQWCGDDIGYLRASNRFKTAPDVIHFYYGFRCARTPEPSP